MSHCVHGPEHRVTFDPDKLLEKCKERYVVMLPDDKPFQALRYENDGEILVVQGPLTWPRNNADERIYQAENNLVLPQKGSAVICHGLVSASHLNGKLGEVRNMKEDGAGILRMEVCELPSED